MKRTAREQQQVQELCAATLRALSGSPTLQLRGARPYQGERPLAWPAPHLRPLPEVDDLRSFRAAADGLALRERATDAAVHAAHAPAEPAARRLFDLLEQYRVEALVPDELPGVRHNLEHRHAAWAEGLVAAGLLETEQGMLVYAVALVCRSRVTGQVLDEQLQDRLEATRLTLAPRIGGAMAALRRLRHDQAAYAVTAAHIAERVASMLRDIAAIQPQVAGQEAPPPDRRGIPFWIGDEHQAPPPTPVAATGTSRLLAGDAQRYRVFTRAHDVELDAATLARGEQLRQLREQLDARAASAGLQVARLARELRALLGQPATDGWTGAQEEGRIDGRLIAQLIASPTERRLFRQERQEWQADCAVTLLLDCSGSMKQHAPRLALLVDLLTRALEQAGVTSEVLGFTTAAWNGGRARRDWLRAGRPPHPGRLNEACHMVFKAAGDPWRRRRRAIAALLKTDYYREGIDGEALEWACRRLRELPQQRRILVVVSDGSPMDSATSLANDPHYLDHHLQQTVAAQGAVGDVEICALGVGLDLSPYYPRSLIVDATQDWSASVLAELVRLMAGRRSRSRGCRPG